MWILSFVSLCSPPCRVFGWHRQCAEHKQLRKALSYRQSAGHHYTINRSPFKCRNQVISKHHGHICLKENQVSESQPGQGNSVQSRCPVQCCRAQISCHKIGMIQKAEVKKSNSWEQRCLAKQGEHTFVKWNENLKVDDGADYRSWNCKRVLSSGSPKRTGKGSWDEVKGLDHTITS